MTEQGEFLFADGVQPELRVPHPLDDLLQEIAEAWGLPVGARVRVRLTTEAVPDLSGRLELARAPELPLNPRQPLALRVAGGDVLEPRSPELESAGVGCPGVEGPVR